MRSLVPDNREIAALLERVADLLAAQDANPYRVRAWRNAASVIRAHAESIAELWRREGVAGLDLLPTIGTSLAAAIAEYLSRGRLAMLERLEGELGPEEIFSTVPGIGPILARRIRDGLPVQSLEELEMAAHDGRLERLHGIGDRRLKAIQDSLAGILARQGRRRSRRWHLHAEPGEGAGNEEPPVALLLEVDAEYRWRAETNELPRIAPRRFNPAGEAWLPILHAERGGWSITALYSNTARAHELGTTRDWVVIFLERGGSEQGYTVVTARNGPLAGKRVVRGRESECMHAGSSPAST